MQPEEIIRGVWRPGQPIDQLDQHTALTWSEHQGAPFVARGVASYVKSISANSTLCLGVSRPGMHSLWYAAENGEVVWDEQQWRVKRYAREHGWRCKPKRVSAGSIVLTDGFGTNEAEVQPHYEPTPRQIELPDAIREMREIVLRVTEEIWTLAGRPKVTVMVSGGTDSTMGLCALREIGADVHGITVGRSPDYFDPKYAKQYCDQLGVEHTLLTLPSDQQELSRLIYRTVSAIENDEGTNLRMGLSTIMVKDWARENDRICIWHGYGADGLLGLSSLTYGDFKKKHEVTDANWGHYRSRLYQHIIPNDMQVAQASRADGQTFWRTFFHHPDLMEFVWSMPMSVAPLSMEKPLFGGVNETWLRNTSWQIENKKVPYNIGSGLWDMTKEMPVLQPENVKKIFKAAKDRLS